MVGFEGVQKGFCSESNVKGITCRRDKDGKGTVTNTGKSGAMNLDAESISSRE